MKVRVMKNALVHEGALHEPGAELDIEDGPELSWLIGRRAVVPVAPPPEPAPLPPVANDPGPEAAPSEPAKAQPEPKSKKEALKDGP